MLNSMKQGTCLFLGTFVFQVGIGIDAMVPKQSG